MNLGIPILNTKAALRLVDTELRLLATGHFSALVQPPINFHFVQQIKRIDMVVDLVFVTLLLLDQVLFKCGRLFDTVIEFAKRDGWLVFIGC